MDTKMEYATAGDFCSIFHHHMASLYQLALLLTANHEMAERIFVSALNECVNGNPVFKQHSHSWAKRVIITNAINAIPPASSTTDEAHGIHETSNLQPRLQAYGEAISGLPAFSRFVFVMTVLEKVSVAECAVLLRSTRENVIKARIRALQAIAEASAWAALQSVPPAVAFATDRRART